MLLRHLYVCVFVRVVGRVVRRKRIVCRTSIREYVHQHVGARLDHCVTALVLHLLLTV